MSTAYLLENSVFERLTVISRCGSKRGQALWSCLCSCGRITQATTHQLTTKNKRSCGCLQNETRRLSHPPTRMLSTGEAAKNKLINTYKNSAKKRNKIFSLTKEQAVLLFEDRCFYCGSEPTKSVTAKGYNGAYTHNGIDRIDSSGDYTLENCVSCCYTCNRMKSDMETSKFITHVKNINTWSSNV